MANFWILKVFRGVPNAFETGHAKESPSTTEEVFDVGGMF